MRESRIILLVIIALVFIIGIYFGLSSTLTNFGNNTTNITNNTTLNQTNNTTYTNKNSTSTTDNNQSSVNSKSSSSDPNNVTNEQWKKNYQAGDGSYYREVNYKDGGMRQYDKNGKLIGSTYDSDQNKLPSME